MAKGLRELLKDYPKDDTPLTLDMVQEYLTAVFADNTASLMDRTSAAMVMGEISPGMYRLYDGTITGKGGWELYQKELKKQLNNKESVAEGDADGKH